jgi:hypothetical protein
LKDLADLLEKGLITREDFEKEKNALMAGSHSAGATLAFEGGTHRGL